jgi:APA family basic amino acid/polyamine antiporter
MAEKNTNPNVTPHTALANKSLKLIYVYAIATGAIFTFIGYWDTTFVSYAGPGTFLAFALMTVLILPIAYVYCELAPMFPSVGGELVYNTIGLNKHAGFFSAWLIMAAWISVPPAAVMAILQWIFKITKTDPAFNTIMIWAIIVLIIYTVLSLLAIEIAGKIQLVMLVGAVAGCLISVVAIMVSGHWSIENYTPFFRSILGEGQESQFNISGWVIGLGLIITPFFGFETVPQMIEEGDYEVKDSTKAIWGSVVTCGVVYSLFFFAIAGVDSWDNLLRLSEAEGGFLAINWFNSVGWTQWAVVFGIFEILCAIGTCLLGFWISTVRLLYAMGRQNFLPAAFARTNRFGQPIVPNILLLAISITFLLLMNATTFVTDFFNLMAFGCACAYAITMISAIRISIVHKEWKSPYHLKGGMAARVLALAIAIFIAVLCTLGQGIGSWKNFAVYLAVGVALWLWMMIYKWKQTPVVMNTPDGEKEY